MKVWNIDKILNPKWTDKPWPHVIIDGILTDEFLKHYMDTKRTNFAWRRKEVHRYMADAYDANPLIKQAREELDSYATEILDVYGCDYKKERSYNIRLRAVKLGFTGDQKASSYVGHPHTDSSRKKWTCVTYIGETGDGTYIHTFENPRNIFEPLELTDEKHTSEQMKWKHNRSFIFNPKQKTQYLPTWHSYYNNTPNTFRHTFMANIVLSKSKTDK